MPGAADASVVEQFAAFARQHRLYVICSTYTKEAGHCYISSVLFDRQGKYVGEYRKANPTDSEMELGVTPGSLNPPVFQKWKRTVSFFFLIR